MSLLEFQRRVAGAIMVPRTRGGSPLLREAGSIVKPNSRLTSLERLDIYRRSYWARILDSLGDDFRGLRGVLGPRAFRQMSEAYLADCPSRSFTLRNLGSRLEGWLQDHPRFGGCRIKLALDMVRLEWAHIQAFDGSALTPLGPDDLLEPGSDLRFELQPQITLLPLTYPVDNLRLRLLEIADQAEKADGGTGAAARRHELQALQRCVESASRPIFLAVHRSEFTVYYRRLAAGEYRLLDALRRGTPIDEAVSLLEHGGSEPNKSAADLAGAWFAAWSRLGWLCGRPNEASSEGNHD